MKLKFKWFEKKVDERQERDILEVEHIGFWAMYWMLATAIFVQAFLVEDGAEHMKAEFIVFMITSVIVLAGWMRRGVWSYYRRKVPGVKEYLGYSLIAMLAVGIPVSLLSSLKWKQSWQDTVASMAILMVFVFIFTFVAFCIIGTITRKREEVLADQVYEENDNEEDL